MKASRAHRGTLRAVFESPARSTIRRAGRQEAEHGHEGQQVPAHTHPDTAHEEEDRECEGHEPLSGVPVKLKGCARQGEEHEGTCGLLTGSSQAPDRSFTFP